MWKTTIKEWGHGMGSRIFGGHSQFLGQFQRSFILCYCTLSLLLKLGFLILCFEEIWENESKIPTEIGTHCFYWWISAINYLPLQFISFLSMTYVIFKCTNMSHFNKIYKNGFKDVANSWRVFKSRDRALISRNCTPRCATHSHAASAVHLTCSACLCCLPFFNLFVGLFGIITFDPFYQTNNTLILHALAELQHDFGHSQCYTNRTRRQGRLVRFASLQMSSMHVALPLMHSETCISITLKCFGKIINIIIRKWK